MMDVGGREIGALFPNNTVDTTLRTPLCCRTARAPKIQQRSKRIRFSEAGAEHPRAVYVTPR